MFRKSILFSIISLILMFAYSCNEDDHLQSDSIKKTASSHQTDSDFYNSFLDFNSSLAMTRTALRKHQKNDGSNQLLEQIIESTEQPTKFRKELKKYYELLNEKDLFAMHQILKENDVVNQGQLDYLNEVGTILISKFEEQEDHEHLMMLTNNLFATKTLQNRFNKNEIPILQFIGIGYMQSILDIELSGITKSCESALQSFSCGLAATIAAAIAGPVGPFLETVGLCDTFLDILGIDPLNIPNWLNEILPDSVTVPGTEIQVSTNGIICSAAVVVGVWQFSYTWCCNTLYGCNEQEDPCCAIECQIGYFCDNGECIKDESHCIHDGCPEGYICNSAGNCVDYRNKCEDNSDCLPGEECRDGSCQPF